MSTETQSANDRQVGGRHYASAIQHWDLVADHDIGYLEGCATKYVSRWRKKAGVQDLEKAGHFVDKLIEVVDAGKRSGPSSSRKQPGPEKLILFAQANDLNATEALVIYYLCTYSTKGHLEAARQGITRLLNEAQPKTPVNLGEAARFLAENHPRGFNAAEDGA